MSKKTTVDRNQLLQQICKYIDPWISDDSGEQLIGEKTNLLSDFGIDSVGIMQIILGVEKDYNITIPEQELDNTTFSRVGIFLDLVEKKINETF